MEKVVMLVWILVVSTSSVIQIVHSTYYSPSEPYKPVEEEITTLRYFFHDTQSGSNLTALRIAGGPDTNNLTAFGTTFAIDDPLTEGPDIASPVIGNARGMYVFSSKDGNLTLVVYFDLGFTTGRFKGSSLSVFSRNLMSETSRELAVVGGRGLFRFAKGFVNATTRFLNLTSGNAVIEHNVVVVHPKGTHDHA